jgi:hypothetical protein
MKRNDKNICGCKRALHNQRNEIIGGVLIFKDVSEKIKTGISAAE